MSIKTMAAPLREWPAAADPVIAYAEWRMACTSVWAAYRHWSDAPPEEAGLAQACYTAALDREDAAARVYARSIATGAKTDPGSQPRNTH